MKTDISIQKKIMSQLNFPISDWAIQSFEKVDLN